MSAEYEGSLNDEQKLQIISKFILQTPPGEFKEVLTDVRLLLNNDNLLKEQAGGIISRYSKDQLTPVQLDTPDSHALITDYNELTKGRYYDPRTQKSFKYDPIRDEASNFQTWTPPDATAELWRSSLEDAWTKYCKEHYYNGVCSVFASTEDSKITLHACIECHQFQPKNYCNGRWRSCWTTTLSPNCGTVDLTGNVRVQVHYFEDGNVQLISSKDMRKALNVTNETQTANQFVEIVSTAESEYQNAVIENYQNMSDTTFKALRRPLPVTKAKLDWNKLLKYKLKNEFKQH